MAYRRLRWLGVALLGSVGVGCLALTSAVIAHADDSALIMGGTGDPDPDETYLVDVYNDYFCRISLRRVPSRPLWSPPRRASR